MRLGRLGHDVDTVRAQGLVGCNDATVWESTQKADRFLITQDMEFSDIRKFAHAKTCLVICSPRGADLSRG